MLLCFCPKPNDDYGKFEIELICQQKVCEYNINASILLKTAWRQAPRNEREAEERGEPRGERSRDTRRERERRIEREREPHVHTRVRRGEGVPLTVYRGTQAEREGRVTSCHSDYRLHCTVLV